MKSYHYLMRLAHLLNTLARFSKNLATLFGEPGVQATIEFIRNTLTGPWLNVHELEQRLDQPFRLRLLLTRYQPLSLPCSAGDGFLLTQPIERIFSLAINLENSNQVSLLTTLQGDFRSLGEIVTFANPFVRRHCLQRH